VSVDRSGNTTTRPNTDQPGGSAVGGNTDRTGPSGGSALTMDQAQARTDYVAELKARLARIDVRLSDLRANASAETNRIGVDLQQKRDKLAARLAEAQDQAASGWDQFKTDVNQGFDSLEAELSAAIH
jgi:hypothetical protein